MAEEHVLKRVQRLLEDVLKQTELSGAARGQVAQTVVGWLAEPEGMSGRIALQVEAHLVHCKTSETTLSVAVVPSTHLPELDDGAVRVLGQNVSFPTPGERFWHFEGIDLL